MSSLVARLGSLSLRAGRSAPAQKAAAAPAALLSARRCASLSAGAAELRAQPAAPRRAAAAAPVVAKLKTRKAAAKRFKITASGKVSQTLHPPAGQRSALRPRSRSAAVPSATGLRVLAGSLAGNPRRRVLRNYSQRRRWCGGTR